jgi:hypothetical protein
MMMRREFHAPIAYKAYSDPDLSAAKTWEQAGRAKAYQLMLSVNCRMHSTC